MFFKFIKVKDLITFLISIFFSIIISLLIYKQIIYPTIANAYTKSISSDIKGSYKTFFSFCFNILFKISFKAFETISYLLKLLDFSSSLSISILIACFIIIKYLDATFLSQFVVAQSYVRFKSSCLIVSTDFLTMSLISNFAGFNSIVAYMHLSIAEINNDRNSRFS